MIGNIDELKKLGIIIDISEVKGQATLTIKIESKIQNLCRL